MGVCLMCVRLMCVRLMCVRLMCVRLMCASVEPHKARTEPVQSRRAAQSATEPRRELRRAAHSHAEPPM